MKFYLRNRQIENYIAMEKIPPNRELTVLKYLFIIYFFKRLHLDTQNTVVILETYILKLTHRF